MLFPSTSIRRPTLLFICGAAASLWLAGCGPDVTESQAPAEQHAAAGNGPAHPGNEPAHVDTGHEAAPQGSGNSPHVVLETTKGTIELELDAGKAPLTVANFLRYVRMGHYDGTIFHRIVKDFMIQGGGMTASGAEKPTDAPIKNEAKNGLHNVRGTISMARTSDPDSATSQFFINVVDNRPKLDPGGFSPDGYAVFGKVVKGLDVVDKIRDVPVQMAGGELSTPTEVVSITKATVKP